MCRLVSGSGPSERINGLDVRLKLSIFLKLVLLDFVPNDVTELISFLWRRNSVTELVPDARGHSVLDTYVLPRKRNFI